MTHEQEELDKRAQARHEFALMEMRLLVDDATQKHEGRISALEAWRMKVNTVVSAVVLVFGFKGFAK